MKNIIKYGIPAFVAMFVLAAVADAQLTPPGSLPSLPRGTLTQTIITLINYVLYLVGTIALIFLIYGGFTYIISAGDEDKIERAKKTITYAVVGLIVVIISWVVVNAVITEVFGGRR